MAFEGDKEKVDRFVREYIAKRKGVAGDIRLKGIKPIVTDFKDYQHEKSATVPVWSIVLEQQPGFDRLDSFNVFGAQLALASLQMGIRMGHLDSQGIHRIADFGVAQHLQ